MKRITQRIAPCLAIITLTSLPIQASQPDETLHLALGPDEAAAAGAVQKIRAAGLAGVDALLAIAPHQEAPTYRRWERVLDTVCAQRDCAASGLYWYTEFERAQAEAERTGRPILSLRLLGRLDEEVSCANSRFFRSILYPDPRIAEVLRQRFVLHWESVRPVPRITIDYGDGRALRGTITGNSIHYVLDSRGRLIDALPGLYGPGLFLELLEEAEQTARHFATFEDATYLRLLARLHTTALLHREREFAPVGGAKTLLAMAPAASSETPTALEAGRLAMNKSIPELPLVEAISLDGFGGTEENPFDWAALVEYHRAQWTLSAASRHLMMKKHRAATGAADDQMLESFERVLGLDTVRNEYLLHTVLHSWLADRLDAVPDLALFNDRVYADLFLTPSSDPWLGLRSPETYLALAPVGEASKLPQQGRNPPQPLGEPPDLGTDLGTMRFLKR
jgi:hypothetical protein